MPESEQTLGTSEIDETIGRIERLYQAATGRAIPQSETTRPTIPPEKDPAQHIEEQLNRLLSLFGDPFLVARTSPAWTPPIAVWESPTEVVIGMDLPGVAREDVEIFQRGKMLTVKGTRILKADGLRLCSTESPSGPFQRTVLVPSAAHGGEPTAEMKNGMLQVRVRKEQPEVAAPKSVRVN